MMTLTEIAHTFHFPDGQALQDASIPVATVGSYTWYVVRTPAGRWAAWDDSGNGEERATLAEALRLHLAGLRMEIGEDHEGVDVDWEALQRLIDARRGEDPDDADRAQEIFGQMIELF